jgi:hypothetical protein
MLPYFIPVLFAFELQDVLKKIRVPKGGILSWLCGTRSRVNMKLRKALHAPCYVTIAYIALWVCALHIPLSVSVSKSPSYKKKKMV